MAAADLCPVTTRIPSRRAMPLFRSLPVCSFAAGNFAATPGPCSSSSARSGSTVQLCIATPDRSPQVRTRCFRAQALHLPCPPYPVGFVMGCQLARRPGLLCSFCPSPRTFALRLPPDKPSRPCPCLRLVVIIDSCRINPGTPTGDFHPITSRPCWAHTRQSTRTLRDKAAQRR